LITKSFAAEYFQNSGENADWIFQALENKQESVKQALF
jgi:hypothetical protein